MVENLKKLRRKKGISQQHLASMLGTTQQSINKYENHGAEPDISMLIKMACCFETSVDFLIGHYSGMCKNQELFGIELDADEAHLVEQYRLLSDKEKESIRMVIDNYLNL